MPQQGSNSTVRVDVSKPLCPEFKLSKIKKATNKFHDSFLIGSGASADVYKAIIDKGASPVAIKRLKDASPKHRNDFWEEIWMASKFRHANVVSLLGYCANDKELILVYEYVGGGTLKENLHKIVSWEKLMQICIGFVQALHYLHTGVSANYEVLHRDVKSSNMVLDESMKIVKILDFGVSRIVPANQPPHATIPVGTPVYWDPYHFRTGILTSKSDVYACGVLLFELLSGRPVNEKLNLDGQIGFANWAHRCVTKGDFKELIDPNLKLQILRSSLLAFVKVADRCLHDDPAERPTMTEVLAELERALKLQKSGNGNAETAATGASHSGTSEYEKPQPISEVPPTNTVAAPENTVAATDDMQVVIDAPSFQLDELKEITHNFGTQALICEVISGNLFKGTLRSGQDSFIKLLDFNKLPEKEFLAQVSMKSKYKHENVVKLLGYCVDGGFHVLAYEYAPNGSLHDILHRKQGAQSHQVLLWSKRVKGAAKGLLYLHERHSNPMIHCNITSKNVLLFETYVAKIADFNLSSDDKASGPYADPNVVTLDDHAIEYALIGQLNSKSEFHCFGIVLLELLTGRKHGKLKEHMGKWVTREFRGDNLKGCIDPRLGGYYIFSQAKKMAEVALLCLEDDPNKQPPSMRSVVEDLQTLLNDSDSPEPTRTVVPPVSHQRKQLKRLEAFKR